MPEEAFILAIIFGGVISIVFLSVIGSIINNWIKRGSGKNLTENKEFLAALREFKEKTDRRLKNLEAIVTDDRPQKSEPSRKIADKKEQKSAIQIEVENESNKESEKQSSKLKNMLNQ
tara:strand:+ start:6647 stop:7000 length:354 start_codon:yes stop_codon:yes gene_type:complete